MFVFFTFAGYVCGSSLAIQLLLPLKSLLLPRLCVSLPRRSSFQALRSIEFYICYYGWGDFRHRKNTCKNSVYNSFLFIVAIIPYVSRLLQVA